MVKIVKSILHINLIMRIALGVEYMGTNFHGWQLQKSGIRTVQEVV